MAQKDIDIQETSEWLDAIEYVIESDGHERAKFLLEQMAAKTGLATELSFNSPYINTIPKELEPEYPGDIKLERKIRSYIRWNAMAIVSRAQQRDSSLGGHIGTFASAATLYDVGYNHFWHSNNGEESGDLLFVQGHSSPGTYARAYLFGDLSKEQLDSFRQEVKGKGLSSYPHPWLMPNFWQFPTVSMGLGPLQAIYQARFMRYLESRGLANTANRDVWCMCGDGEMDEVESLGALSLAAREKLDNLVFVVNCNLQRLDGPVRGNFKIIQELESVFKGAGWKVIKVVWGSGWDALLAKDSEGHLKQRMLECVDGDYQNYKAKDGAYTREHFFGKSPQLKEMVENLSDKDIYSLKRGGHDVYKIYAAYKEARETKGKPVVVLAKTVKGYGLGDAGEAKNTAHNTKKLLSQQLLNFRDRFKLDLSDSEAQEANYISFAKNSPEYKYIKNQRSKLGGGLHSRRATCKNKLKVPNIELFKDVLAGSGDRSMSSTMAFVRILNSLVKDKNIGKNIVPIIPDEARTFGMEPLFRQLGIYSSVGQNYKPVDADELMYYKESKQGQVLQEGINEAGSFCSWLAAATSYSVHNVYTIPFYIFYSMFGFQRIGDLAWLAGDIRARGFLIGATAGRTTLNGEGLQHEDGHSHIFAATIPNCISYDPTFAYELAVIINSGMQRMYKNDEDVFYYITTMNENYNHPAIPKGSEEGIVKGLYKLQIIKSKEKAKAKVQLLGCGTILLQVIEAGKLLAKEFGVQSTIFSVTSFNELTREAQLVEHYNHRNPEKKAKISYVAKCLTQEDSPVIAATDYIRAYSEQIRAYIPNSYTCLGTDGFGRSDTRESLRDFFEVDSFNIAYTAVLKLVQQKKLPKESIKIAKKKWNISSDKVPPWTV